MKKIPYKELVFTFSRSSGPGGQNVNKVETKVRLTWDYRNSVTFSDDEKERISIVLNRFITDGKIIFESQRFRSREQNRKDAISKLENFVNKALMPRKKRIKSKITTIAKENRLRAKKLTAEKKKNRSKDIEID